MIEISKQNEKKANLVKHYIDAGYSMKTAIIMAGWTLQTVEQNRVADLKGWMLKLIALLKYIEISKSSTISKNGNSQVKEMLFQFITKELSMILLIEELKMNFENCLSHETGAFDGAYIIKTYKDADYNSCDFSICHNEVEKLKKFTVVMAEHLPDLDPKLHFSCVWQMIKTMLDESFYLVYEKFQEEIKEKQNELSMLKLAISDLERDSRIFEAHAGFHEPKYDFTHSALYKARLEGIRNEQKDCMSLGRATKGYVDEKTDKYLSKLMLRTFNNECDAIIDKAKWNTSESSYSKITSSYETISKLGAQFGISISFDYYSLKLEELALAIEYRQKKQDEREEHAAVIEQMKESVKVQKEIENERNRLDKERNHYETALRNLNKQFESANEDFRYDVLERKSKIEAILADIERQSSDLDLREATQTAGYVYVISNIGSFGENIYKIGVTRRLNPQERVDELGSASVPFRFDVHAMIFSEDAYSLEKALHKAFEEKKVNMINKRKEFFDVTLNEIKAVVMKNFDKTVEFIEIADAEQYWASVKMRERSIGT
jgi:hypothetical protein